MQEGSRIDSEPNFRNRKSAHVKNRNFSSTESLQPSIFQTQPNRRKTSRSALFRCDVFSDCPKVRSFRAAVPHWNVHTACHWPGPASGAFTKCVSLLFLFLAFLSNMLLRRHGKGIFTNCMSISFSFPLLSLTLSFPFLVLFLSFPICFLDCQENAYSQIAYLTCPFPFPFLSFPICFLDCQEKAYSQIAYLTCPFPFPVHYFAFLSFLFLFFDFLSNMLFGRPGKKHIHKLHSHLPISMSISFSIPFQYAF